MSSRRRHRKRKPARPEPFLEPKPRILVVCEGQVTEPQYLTGFKNAWKNPRVDIVIAPEHGVPRTLVEAAKKRKKDAESAARQEKDENLKFDAVWCVFDVDEHPHIPDATQMAHDNGIGLAISNPSFELWLLLHFRESPGMKDRQAVKALLKKFVDNYDKHVNYADYQKGYEDAVKRAMRLEKVASRASTPGCNPTTGVAKLTESIRDQ
jgi:hypothetical protein